MRGTMKPIHQPFICSYAKDFTWLEQLLWSLERFGKKLAPPCVCVASEDYEGAHRVIVSAGSNARVVVKDGPAGKGMMRAMVAMMSADVMCPTADFIWLFGSDCFVTEGIEPEDFFQSGKPIMCYTPYRKFTGMYPGGLKWKAGTERILGLDAPHECMRRLPGVYPARALENVRTHISNEHNSSFEEFCYGYPHDDFSEANLIGAWALHAAPDYFSWQQTEFNPTLQFWSHGGMDRPCDGDVMYCGGNARTKTPRDIIAEIRAKNP